MVKYIIDTKESNLISDSIKRKTSNIVYKRGEGYYKKRNGIVSYIIADGCFLTIESEFYETKDPINTSITVKELTGDYVEGYCDCTDYQIRKNICKHMVALSILSNETESVQKFLGTEEIEIKFKEEIIKEQREYLKKQQEENDKLKEKIKEKKIISKLKKEEEKKKNKEFELQNKLNKMEEVISLEIDDMMNVYNDSNINRNINDSTTIDISKYDNLESSAQIITDKPKRVFTVEIELYKEIKVGYSNPESPYKKDIVTDVLIDKLNLDKKYINNTLESDYYRLDGRTYVKIKIGSRKHFYVSNLLEFLKAVKNNEYFNITKSIKYDPMSDIFSAQSQILIDKLYNYLLIEKNYKKLNITNNGIEINGELSNLIFDEIDSCQLAYSKNGKAIIDRSYTPIFTHCNTNYDIFLGNTLENDKIYFRDILSIAPKSKYYYKRDNLYTIYKMSDDEYDFMIKNNVPLCDIYCLSSFEKTMNDKNNEIGRKQIEYLQKNIPIAYISKNKCKVEVKLWKSSRYINNFIYVTVQNLNTVERKNGNYYICQNNDEVVSSIWKELELFHSKDYNNIAQLEKEDLETFAKYINENHKNDVVIKMDDSLKHIRSVKLGVMVNNISNNLLEIKFESEGLSEYDVEIVVEGIKRDKKYVTLSSGEFVEISSQNKKQYLDLIKELDDMNLDNNKINIIQSLKLSKLSKEVSSQINKIKEIKKIFNKIKSRKENLPANIKVDLFAYQKIGYNWLKKMYDLKFGCILADDMGLGKTIQTISMLQQVYNENKNFLGLVIVPTSLLYNWKEEVLKYSYIKPILIEGQAYKRRNLIQKTQKGLLITTYQSLRNDIDHYQSKLFNLAILDEAQNIKTYTSQIKKSVMKINSQVNFALTGTPVENNLFELWSIFDFVLPGYLGTLNQFKRKYKDILLDSNTNKLKKLKNIIEPFILRRTKKDVLTELPDKIETNVVVYMSCQQKQLYMSYVAEAKKQLKKMNKNENNRIKILSILTKLRQICNSPALFQNGYNGEIAKIEVLKDLLPEIVENNHRFLIFSQFVGTLKEIKTELKKQNIEFFYIDGKVKSSERLEICNKFNNGERQVVLISLKAGGTGLNLVGADVVIHYDPWWNVAFENQASDRAYRIGQKNSVQVIKLVTAGTIEEKIIEIQERKNQLSSNLLSDSANNKIIFDMSDEEIIDLLT